MKRIVYKLRIFLTGHEDTKGELKRAIVAFYIIGFAAFGSIIFAISDTLIGKPNHAIFDIIASITFIFCLLLINYGKFGLAKIIGIFTANGVLTLNSINESFTSGNYVLLFPILSATLMIFSKKEKIKIITSFVFSLICFGFHEYLEFGGFIIDTTSIQQQKANSIISFLMSAFLVCFNIFTLININLKTEEKLKLLNNKLKKSNSNLLKTNDELDSFVYRASHDLRSPLASILGLIELSKLEHNIDKIKEYLVLKERSVRKLDNYILDILNMSRNSKQKIILRKLDLKEIILESFNQLNYIDNARRIHLEITMDNDEPFYGDYSRISTIISNLISNGIKYCDIQKQENFIRFKVDSTKKMLHIHYFDNGQGIQSVYLNKIFDMYFRANERNSGSGLGLYIVKETIIKMKGTIEVNSQHGLWTQFFIQIPNTGY
ncbi:MAG: HAMP domain-containing sensor histidine kinase [Bacteroidota bacterium]|nr:HAMP domain-containing sensor histidine kinase [Bacteroidota bacterium]